MGKTHNRHENVGTETVFREAVQICRLSELRDGEGRSVWLEVDNRKRTIVLVRRGAEAFAYADRCPHMETSLLWDRKVLMTADGSHIRCANHDALFRVEDGVCTSGPCEAERLQGLSIKISRGIIWLLLGND